MTLDDLKIYLWITGTGEDDKLQFIVDWVNQEVENMLWFDPVAQNYTNILIDGNGQKSIILRERPLNSITSFYIKNWETWDAITTGYYIQKNIWCIDLDFTLVRWFKNYKITYNAWRETLPADINLASLQYAWSIYSNPQWVKSESVSWDSITYGDNTNFIKVLNKYVC